MARRSRKQEAPTAAASRPKASGPRSAVWWHLLLLVAVTFAVYGNSLSNGFVSDDDFQILSNRLITDYHNLPKLFTTHVWAFAHQETSNYYRPLFTTFSTWIGCSANQSPANMANSSPASARIRK